jgi:hypothetical protein
LLSSGRLNALGLSEVDLELRYSYINLQSFAIGLGVSF